MKTPLLAARGISKIYPGGIRALDRVDLELFEGEVHALLGENGAGKSTLAKILYGLLYPDEGRVEYRGSPVRLLSPRDALRLGILYVPQYPLLPQGLSLREVVSIYAEARGFEGDAWRAVERAAEELGWGLDARRPTESLSLVERQRFMISLALGLGFEVLMLDEPTSFLSGHEVDRLLGVIGGLKGRVTVLYITHRIGEVKHIADRVTVLRRGRVAARLEEPRGVSDEELVKLITGGSRPPRVERRGGPSGEPVLVVEGLRVLGDDGRPAVNGVSIAVRRGEVVAIVGIEGMGQREFLEAIVGVRPRLEGSVRLRGVEVGSIAEFRRLGGRYVPGDRLEALALDMSVAENIVSPRHAARYSARGPLLIRKLVYSLAERIIREFNIVARPATRLRGLSGGNQQKVLLGRELGIGEPSVLVLHNPTAGLDVASSQALLARLAGLAERGAAILFSTPSIEEAVAVADRILVWRGGRVVAEFERGAPVEEVAKRILA